jgi:uncharacterized protein (DUF927 family)
MHAVEMLAPLSAAVDKDSPQQRAAADGSGWRIVSPVPDGSPVPQFRHRDLGEPVAVWTYRDAAGGVLGYVCRFQHADGAKEIRVRTLWADSGGLYRWRWASWPVPRPLYGLEKLAARLHAQVIVTEGERAADAAAELFPDYVAVTSPGGAQSARKADWSPLVNRQVTIWKDHDESGAKYACSVSRLANTTGAAVVRVVDVPADWPDRWDLADPLPDGVDAGALRAMLDGAQPIGADTANNTIADGVCHPFRLRTGGVYYAAEDKDGNIDWQWVCSPLQVLAVTRDADAREHGRLLRIEHLDGGVHEWAMPMSLLAGDGVGYREHLLSLGLRIAVGRRARDRLHEYLSTTLPAARVRCVPRTGWHGDVYVLADGAVGTSDGGELVILQGAHPADLNTRTSGRLAEWQEHVAAPCVGNSRLAFALACAFAAPLLALTGDESGGYHLRGASSTGKTTALRVAASAWGSGGDRGHVQSWRATANGLEGIAVAHSDGLLCLDELGQVPARDAGEVAYMLSNGTGKRRARADGSARRAAEWRLLWFSTGELALGDKMREAGLRARAGQDVRLVEIPADAGAGFGVFEMLHGFADGAALARHLRDATARFYGVAIRAYLARVAADRQEIAAAVEKGRRRWVGEHCPTCADGQVERVADRCGLIAAAGELATVLRILPWPDHEASRAAAASFAAWLSLRGGTGPAELARGIEQVRLFIARHGASRFERRDGDIVRDRAGWIRDADGEPEYLILPAVWRAEVCAGHDASAIAAALADAGHLRRGNDGKPQRTERPPGMRSQRVYVLSASILGEGGEAVGEPAAGEMHA